MVYNLENFFVFMEKYTGQDLTAMDEFDWQHLPARLLANKSLKNLFKIKHLIEKHQPDIIMCTEVGGRLSLNNFAHHFLDDRYTVFHKDSNSDRGIDLGYFVKNSLAQNADVESYRRYPIKFLYPHEIKMRGPASAKNSHRFSRDVLFLSLEHAGKKIGLMLTHLKSKLDFKGIDPMGYLRREAECRAMLEIYKAQESHFDMLFIGGDLNGFAQKKDTDIEFEQVYKNTELEDVLELANCPGEDRFTYLHQKRTGQLFSTQLDYLFIHKKHQKKMIAASVDHYTDFINDPPTPKMLAKRRRLLPSDHFPILAEFSLV
jgi:endonuclease/exonuclease/phosphatase family metal-dependent hydrolase